MQDRADERKCKFIQLMQKVTKGYKRPIIHKNHFPSLNNFTM